MYTLFHQPHGLKCGNGTEVLRLKRTLYGLRHLPKYFFKHCTKCLVKQGLSPSNNDPCLFMSSSLIVIIYADNILIYGRSDDKINDFILQRVKTEDIALIKDGTC